MVRRRSRPHKPVPVCPITKQTIMTMIGARLEASSIRSAAPPGTPERNATAGKCAHCDGWHVHLPPKHDNDRPNEQTP